MKSGEDAQFAGAREKNRRNIPEETVLPKKKKRLKRFVIVLGNGAFYLMLLLMVFLVFSMMQNRFKGGAPSVGGFQMYIVQGGSMSPTFEVGSLAFIKPVEPRELARGDIITYHSVGGGNTLTTHRIMDVHREGGQIYFTTKGDANQTNDQFPVFPENIVGRLVFTVPHVGYLMNFSQTKTGILTLVIIPGVLIAAFEIRNLLQYAAEWEKEKKRKRKTENESFSGEK